MRPDAPVTRLVGSLAAAVALALAPGQAAAAAAAARVEVVVGLEAPSLAQARSQSRVLTHAARCARLRLDDPASVAYLAELARGQRAVRLAIERRIASASVRRRYRVTLNALAVVLPAERVPALARVPGIRQVYPTLAYRAQLDRSVPQIGIVPDLLGAALTTAGNGIKIAVVDDGIPSRHPFFDPAGYTAPPGFPRGPAEHTSAKVIVARAYAPPGTTWAGAAKPFDPRRSAHGTHVAGIAAGNAGVAVPPFATAVSGVAPRAFLGNYKVLSVPDGAGGLFGGSPEVAAAIEAAVRDEMDVINLSLGAPEIAPERDVVAASVEGAVAAGAVVVAAAGNDYADYGAGSVLSPATAAGAIAVAAAGNGRLTPEGVLGGYSAGGPTPVTLQAKPDLTAPGGGILSARPASRGSWDVASGTSMAAPHVAGAAALLRQRFPDWPVERIAAALTATAQPVYLDPARTREAPASRQGGGMLDVRGALAPRIAIVPRTLSLGFVRPGGGASRTLQVADAGGGAGAWRVTADPDQQYQGVSFTVSELVDVPGALTVAVAADAKAGPVELSGFVVLSRAGMSRRVPFWGRVDAFEQPDPDATLDGAGTYDGDTAGKAATTAEYRYPDRAGKAAPRLPGPEQVFRVTLTEDVANFGVAIVRRDSGAEVVPRILSGRPRRLAGFASLPLVLDPRSPRFRQRIPVAAAIAPVAGDYDIVFDSPSAATAGQFRFRLWVDDVQPPELRLVSRVVRRPGRIVVSVVDRGSGVDPSSLLLRVDGGRRTPTYSRERSELTAPLGRLRPGIHTLTLMAADRQAAKDGRLLADGGAHRARLEATFRVR